MRCPLCRAGIDTILDIDCIPMKWKDAAEAHVERFRSHDLEQQSVDDEHDHIHEQSIRIIALQLHMVVYFTLPDGAVHGMVVNFLDNTPTTDGVRGDDLRLRVPRAQVRTLSRVAIGQNATHMNFVVFARRMVPSHNVRLQEIAQSGQLHVPVAESYRASMFEHTQRQELHGVPHRDVVVVHQTAMRSTDDDESQQNDSVCTFGMGWQVYPSRTMNTLTDVSFSVNTSDLTELVGGMISDD
jgi:hypothetical protein